MKFKVGKQESLEKTLKWLWIFWGKDEIYGPKTEVYFRPKIWRFEKDDFGNYIRITFPLFLIRHHR